MVYSDTPIIIRLIRDTNNSTLDDTVVIRRNNSEGAFEITYTDCNEGRPVTHKATFLPHSRVADYVYILFKNQYLDEEAFNQVQLELPAMPRVIVSGDKFNQDYYRKHFAEAIDVGLYMLEATEKVKKDVTPLKKNDSFYCSSAPSRPCSQPAPSKACNFSCSATPKHIYFNDSEDSEDSDEYDHTY